MAGTAKQNTSATIDVWKVAPGQNAYMWEDCLASGCTTINWLNHRNFNDFKSLPDTRRALPKKGEDSRGALYIWDFVKEIQLEDVVVANKGLSGVVGIGRVTSKYLHPKHPENPRKSEAKHCHARRVKWLVTDSIDLPQKLFQRPTVEQLDSEQCDIIKRTYLKQFPEYKDTLDKLFPLSGGSQCEQEEDIKRIEDDPDIGPTTKKALIDARKGQGKFRKSVLKRWGHRCAVTSSVTDKAIRASHIQPWRECTNHERLDPDNGLPLIANLDALFDIGLISFESSGNMIVSPVLSVQEQKIFGIGGQSLTKAPTPKMAAYLAVHRHKHGYFG
jgi:hypothetical protein